MSKRDYRVVNVGSHVNPPAQMWEEYFPKELSDRAPRRVVREFDGQGEYEAVVLEGVAYRQLDSQIGIKTDGELVAASGVPFARSFSGGHPGQRDPLARLEAQDLDGIDADVRIPATPSCCPRTAPHDGE